MKPTTEELIDDLEKVGSTQAGALTTETGLLWHPANLLLPAAERLRSLEKRVEELEGALREFRGAWEPVFSESRQGRYVYLDHEANDPLIADIPNLAAWLAALRTGEQETQ